MHMRRLSSVFGLSLSLMIGLAMVPGCAATAQGQASGVAQAAERRASSYPSLAEYERRTAVIRQNVPTIIKAAEAAAARTVENPLMLVNVPYGLQGSFAEEILNRSGGLANALPPEERPKLMTPQDVMLMSVRSWEADAGKVRQMIKLYGSKGSYNIVFGSKAGMPEDIAVDLVIDNGAATGGKSEAAVNAVVNITHAWLWCVEYAAALTRQGKTPGVLQSMLVEGSEAHNKTLQGAESRRTLGVATRAVPAGEYAAVYLARHDALLDTLHSPATADQVNAAADLIAAHLKAGGKVGVASCTHILSQEIMIDSRTPIKPFNVVWRSHTAFRENLAPGDVAVFFGYIGVATPNEDYDTPMKELGLKRIVSFSPDTANPANNAPDAAVHIDQHWALPDAEVKIDFAPGVMAPISGVDQGLLFRMLEDAVIERTK